MLETVTYASMLNGCSATIILKVKRPSLIMRQVELTRDFPICTCCTITEIVDISK